MNPQVRSYFGGLLFIKRFQKHFKNINNLKLPNILKWFLSLNGLVFTILVGILINSSSNFIQDKIQRQRYLELLQLELRMNHSNAVTEINNFNDTGIIYNHVPYQTAVYQSGLQTGYILTLNPDILGELYILYSGYLPKLNQIADHQVQIRNKYMEDWEHCIIDTSSRNLDTKKTCELQEQLLKSVDKTYSGLTKDTAVAMEKTLWDISVKFNPTQERLKSPILRFFMGDHRLKIQE